MSARLPAWGARLAARGTGWMHLSGTALALIAVAALNNLLGYVRDIMLAAWYGASPQSDAFFVGSFVPLLIYQIVVLGSLVPAFLPVLVQTGGAGADAERLRGRLVWTTTGLAAGLGLLLVVAMGLAAPGVVALIAPGLAPEGAAEAVTVLRLSLPLVLFVAPAGVLSAALNTHNRFLAPALGAAATNVGVVVALLLAGQAHGIEAAAVGMSAGSAIGLAVVVWAGRGNGKHASGRALVAAAHDADPADAATPEERAAVGAAGVRRTAALGLPLLATVGLVQAVAVAERDLGSRLPPGSLSLLAYAMKLNLLPIVILAGTLTTMLFPTLSRAAQGSGLSRQQAAGSGQQMGADGRDGAQNPESAAAFSRELARGITQVVTWTVPAAGWLIVCAGPVMQLLYQRGQFGAADSARAAGLLALYALGLVPHALMQMLPRAYHSRQDMLRPLVLHGGALLAYLAFAIPASMLGGVAGLAGAFSAYAYVTLGLFTWGLRHDLRPVAGALGWTLMRALVSGLLLAATCAGIAQATAGALGQGLVAQGARVALLAVAGLAVYAASMTGLNGVRRMGGQPTSAVERRAAEVLEQE